MGAFSAFGPASFTFDFIRGKLKHTGDRFGHGRVEPGQIKVALKTRQPARGGHVFIIDFFLLALPLYFFSHFPDFEQGFHAHNKLPSS
jgi:hypothetical protein